MAKSKSKFPWKSNFLKVPKSIYDQLKRVKGKYVVVAAVVRIRLDSANAWPYGHLGVSKEDLSNIDRHSAQPRPDSGKYSLWNEMGWEVVRKDLPMIEKTYSWETPNFGDASTYGTHTTYMTRDVYQRTYYEPTRYKISIEKVPLAIPVKNHIGIKFAVDCILDRESLSFSDDLLFCLNLLQENVGVVGVFPSDATKEDYSKTISVDWEIFPSGSIDDNISFLLKVGRAKEKEKRPIIERRVKLLSSLRPKAYIRGHGGMASYIGALFADDLVVFENINYGNALYVLYENWAEVSQRSRRDLLKGTSEKYDRFTHTDGWEERLKDHMSREIELRTGRKKSKSR